MPSDQGIRVETDIASREPSSFHSRYDPQKEAVRHVEQSLTGKKPSLVFILGGGKNFIGAALQEAIPHCRSVLLQPTTIFDASEITCSQVRWSPSSVESIEETISRALEGEYLSGGVSIIEWFPVTREFPERTTYIRNALQAALEIESSHLATSSFWAYRWLKNSIRFALAISRQAVIVPGNMQIVLACAGPSLAGRCATLRALGRNISLWSLSSATSILRDQVLLPEMVITTDPGFWNCYHLYDSLDSDVPLALPPSAFAPSAILERLAIVPLCTGLSFEKTALEAIGATAIDAVSSGSSAGTAIALALQSTSGQLQIVGLDLAAHGTDDHAKPYAFDILDEIRSSRISPEFSRRIARVFDTFTASLDHWRTSRPFAAYSQTIKVQASQYGRVYRCSDSPVELDMQRSDLSIEALEIAHAKKPGMVVTALDMDFETRRDHLARAFRQSIEKASAEARIAILDHRPIPHETTLLYRALAGRKAAETIANAARGSAKLASVEILRTIAMQKLDEMIRL
jgi:hypothetical protein